MAIDCDILGRQQRATGLEVMRLRSRLPRRPCTRCGSPTSSTSGLCRACHNGQSLPDPKQMTTERLVTYRDAITAELLRRRSEIEAALKETKP